MNLEFKKRIITSLILLILLVFMYLYPFILIVSLIIIAVITWIEFYGLISRIFHKSKILKFIFKSFSMIYLSLIVFGLLYIISNKPELKIFFVYSILVSIASDVGGLIFGKFFKGRKLTKISPKKTISGSIGSFVFSFTLIPFFLDLIVNHEILSLFVITAFISLTTQLGDLFISFTKRKAKVKDTSDLLPGHGGVLDRIDGIIFSIPIGYLLLNYF
jgi:phosphatidate cytidylyltransferase|tara:strand:- start:3 stop:653 length:651 start_codon:yes stop_codon:yes gene_type:complete